MPNRGAKVTVKDLMRHLQGDQADPKCLRREELPQHVLGMEQSHSFLVTPCSVHKSIGNNREIFSSLGRDKKSHMLLLPIDLTLQI